MDNNKYKIRLTDLKELCIIGKKISKINNGMTGKVLKTLILEDIVEKLVLHCFSFVKLLEANLNGDYSELDASALASIARDIMECSNVYFFYAERKISNEELEFRHEVSILNYDKNMLDIIRKLDFPMDNFKTQLLKDSIIARSIEKTQIYKSLSKQEKSWVLSGNKAFLFSRQKNKREILNEKLESGIYNLFSNSVHSFNLGLGNNSIRHSIVHGGYIGVVELLFIANEMCIIYTSNIIKDYLDLRKIFYGKLTTEEKKKLNLLTKLNFFVEWLEEEKKKYNEDLFGL